MSKFKILYSFDGNGSCEVEAENEDEAVEKFYDGEFSNDVENGQSYEVNKIIKQ